MEDSLSRRVHVNHLVAMSSYGTDLHYRILRASPQDVKYMEIMYRLQQSTGTCTCIGNIGTCTCSTGIGTCNNTSIGTGIGTCVSAQDVDYCLTTDGSVRFRDRIYVLDVVSSRR